MILLFLLLTAASAAVMIVKDYEETNVVKGDGSLITIKLDTPEVDVSRIDWCKSPIPNPVSEEDRVPADLDECKAPGLMHMQLFPNTRDLVQQPVTEPGTIYIDARNIGGADTRHQFNIMVTTASGNIFCVRFNALRPVKHADSTTSSSSSPSVLITSAPATTDENKENEQVTSTTFAVAAGSQNPQWMSSFVVFLSGIFVIILGAVFVRHKMNKNNSTTTLPLYRGDSTSYEFEMVPRNTASSDKELLTMLGTGANPAFFVNK